MLAAGKIIKMNLTIKTIDDFNEASECLHDATITETEIKYDSETRRFVSIFNRRKWEDSKRQGFLRRTKIKGVHSQLTFENVDSMDFDLSGNSSDIFELSHMEFIDSEIQLLFHNNAILKLKTNSLAGTLIDLDTPWDIEKGPISLSFGKD